MTALFAVFFLVPFIADVWGRAYRVHLLGKVVASVSRWWKHEVSLLFGSLRFLHFSVRIVMGALL